MFPFRRLKVWQKAHQLSIACHNATFRQPVGGTAPGFRSQFLRAIDAIPDNIAEGAAQESQRQFARYLETALASAHEADNQLERGRAIEIFNVDEARDLQERLWEVKRMLTALLRAVRRRIEGEKNRDDGKDEQQEEEDPDDDSS